LQIKPLRGDTVGWESGKKKQPESLGSLILEESSVEILDKRDEKNREGGKQIK